MLRLSFANLSMELVECRTKLRELLEYARAWDAVALLDHADMFVQKREMADLNRNSLVEMFLNELENFSGTLFVTTDRVGTFDQACMDVFQIIKRVDQLTPEARYLLWKRALKDAESDGVHVMNSVKRFVSESPIVNEANLNARQIKNCLSMAVALARSEGEDLNRTHLEKVLDSRKQFDNSVGPATTGNDDTMRAAPLRARRTDPSVRRRDWDNRSDENSP